MKFTIVCALVAAVQTIVTPGDATDTKNNAAGAAPTPYVAGINPDVAKDAAYYNESSVDHPTAPETTLTPSSQMNIWAGTTVLTPTTTKPPVTTSEITEIPNTTSQPTSSVKTPPSRKEVPTTQKPSMVPNIRDTTIPLPHSSTTTTQPGNEQKYLRKASIRLRVELVSNFLNDKLKYLRIK